MSPVTPFEEDGFIAYRGFLSAEALCELQDNVRRFITDIVPRMPREHVFYENKSDASSLKQLQRLFEYDSYFRALMFDSPFQNVAADLLQEPVRGVNFQYFNKPPQIGKPTPPHQDGHYFMLEPPSAVTMWLALDAADEENGCVRYVRGSHLAGPRPHAATQTLGFSQGITDFGTPTDLQNEVVLRAAPGDLLIHHALTIHRADGNRSSDRPRRALGLIYYGASARESPQKSKRQVVIPRR